MYDYVHNLSNEWSIFGSGKLFTCTAQVGAARTRGQSTNCQFDVFDAFDVFNVFDVFDVFDAFDVFDVFVAFDVFDVFDVF